MSPPQVEGVRHRDVVVRGLRLHVAEAGEGDAVLLVHGWPQHWWCWRDLIPAVAERHRVVCPDLRGFGWSEAPADDDYLKETLVDDLLGLLGELGIDRVSYVGHDWGAFLGFLLCLRDDHPVERMVSISVLPPWPPPGALDPRRALRFSYQVPIASPGIAAFKDRLPATVLQQARRVGRWTPQEFETYMRPLRQPAGRRASTLLYRTFLLREMLPIARGRYTGRRLLVPTYFMIGDRDLLHDEGTEAHVRANADRIEVEAVPDTGHFLPEERPDLVRDRVLAFLARTNGKDAGMETTQGPGEPDREGFVSEEAEEGDSPKVHTKPGEGHPGGEGERSDRDIGGPTSPDDSDE